MSRFLEEDDFGSAMEQYKERAGRETFTSFALPPRARAIALLQMKQYISGERKALVTNDSIGVDGEGVRQATVRDSRKGEHDGRIR